MGQSDVLGWLLVVLFASLGERFVVAQDCARISSSSGAVDTQNVTNGAIATITCDPCHEIGGERSVTLTCVNGAWISSSGQIVRLFFCTQIDDVECDSLAPLPDHVSPVDDREPEDLPTGLTFTAQLKCDEGYNLTSGNLARTCECDNSSMGQWSGSDPVCSRIYCSSLGVPENGFKSTNETEFGTNVEFLCDDGFILSGDPELTCGNQGLWSGSVPQCLVVKCPNLIDPFNGYSLGNGTDFGDVLSFGCVETFRLVGNRSLECQANAQWNASTPTCEKITCTVPPITNGSVIGISESEANISSLISFLCDEGFDRNGSATIQCEASGFWNETEPGCIIRTCPELTAPQNGLKDSNSSVYGTVVTFMCDQGYALQGNDSLMCLASGQWDGSQPSCLSPAARPTPTETIRLSTLSSAEFSFLKEGSSGFQLSSSIASSTVIQSLAPSVEYTLNSTSAPLLTESIRLSTFELSSRRSSLLTVSLQSSSEVLKTSSSIASSTVIQSLAPSVGYISDSKSSRRSSLLGEASLSVGLQLSSEVLRQSSVLYQTSPSSEESVKASSIAPSTVIQSSGLSVASDSAPSFFTARSTPMETIRLSTASPVDFSTGRFPFSNSTSLSGSTLRAFLFQTSSTVTADSLFPSAVIRSSGQPESAIHSDSNQVALSTFVPLPSVSVYEISTSRTARQESVLEVQASSQVYSQGIESSALLVSSAIPAMFGSSPGVDLTSFGPSETSAFLSSTTFDPRLSPTSFLKPSSPVSEPESSIAAFHQVISSVPDSSAVDFQSESRFLSSSGVVSNSFPVPSFLVPSVIAATSTTALVPTPTLPSRSERASEFFSLNPSIVSSIDVENVFTVNPSREFEPISSSSGRMTVIASSASIETGILSASSRIDVEMSSSSVAVGESPTSTLIFSSQGLSSATSTPSLETISSKDLVSPTSTVAFLQGLTSTPSFDIASSEGFSSKVTSISSLETISSKDLPLQGLTSTSSLDIAPSEGFLSTTANLATAVTSTSSLETISSKDLPLQGLTSTSSFDIVSSEDFSSATTSTSSLETTSLPLQSLTSTSSFDIVSSEGFPSVTSAVISTSSLDFAPEDLTSTPSIEIASSDGFSSVSGVQATALPSASFPILSSVYVPSSATIPRPTLPSFQRSLATTTLVVEPPQSSFLSTRFPLTRTVTPTVSIRATSLASLRTVTIDSSQFETVASTPLRPSSVVVFQSSDSLPLLNVSSSVVEFLEPSSTPALVSSSASSVSSALSSASTFQSIMSSVAEPETLSSTQLPLETSSFLSSRFSSVVTPEPSSSSVFISTPSSSVDFSTSFSSVFISALSSSSIASSQFSIRTATSSSSEILPADFSTSLLSSSEVSLMASLRTSSVIPTAVEPTLPPTPSLVSTALQPANNSALSSAVAPTIPSISGSTLSSEFLLRSTSLAVSFPVQMTSSFDVPDPSSTGLSSVDVREVSSTGFLFSSSSIVGTRLSTALQSSSVFAEAFFSSVSPIRSSDDQIPVATSTLSFSSSLDIAGTSSIFEFSSLPFSSSSLTSSISQTISSEFFDVVSSSSDVGFAGISSSIFTSSVRVSAELSTPIPIVNSTIIPISSFDDLVPSTTIFSSSSSRRFVVSSTAVIVSEVSSTSSIISSGVQSSISLEPSPTIVAMFSPPLSTIIGFVSSTSTAVFDIVSLPTLSTASSLFPPVIDFPTKTIAPFSSPPILSSSLGRFPDVSSSLLISSDAVFVQTSSATILSRIRTSTTILSSQIVDFVSSIAELSPIISSSSFESSLTVSSALIPPSSSRFSTSTFVFSSSFAADFAQSTSAVFPSFLSSTSQPGFADNSTVIASSLLVTSTAFLPVSSTSVLEPEATFSVRNFSSISSTASTFVFPSSSAELSVGITSSLSLVEPFSTSLQFFSTSTTSSAVLETTSALAVASSTFFRLPMVLSSSSFVFPVLTSSAVRLVDFVSSTAAFSSAALMVNATETVPPTQPTPSFLTSASTTNVTSRNVSTTFPPTSAALVSSTPTFPTNATPGNVSTTFSPTSAALVSSTPTFPTNATSGNVSTTFSPTSAALVSSTPTFPTNATPGNVSTTSAPSSTAFPTNATAGNISTTSAATLVPSTPTFPTNATSGNISTTSAPSSATLVPSTPTFPTNATSGNSSTTSAPSSTVNATFPLSTAAPAPSTPSFPSNATPGNVSATSATFPVNATLRSNVSTSPTVNATDATTSVPSPTSGNVSTTSAPSPTANATSTPRFPTNATSGNISTASAVSPTLNATGIPALGNATTFPTISSTSASSPTVNATELRPTNAAGTVSPATNASEAATPTTTTEKTTEIPTNATEFARPAPTNATSMSPSPTTPTNRLPTTATSPANESTPLSPTRYPPIAFWTELVFRLNFLDIHLSDLEWLLFMTSNLEEAYNEAKTLAATVEKRRRREERPVVVTIINATTENQAANHAIVVFYVRDRGELIDAETVTNLLRLHEAQTINGIIGYEVVRVNPYPYQAPTQLPITDDAFPLWAIVLIIVLTICLLLLLLLIICYCCWRSKYTDKVTLLQQREYVAGKRLEEGSEPPGIELKHYNDILKEKLPPSQPIASWIEEDDDADDEADVEQRKIIVVESQDESSRDDVRKPLPDIRDVDEATYESPPGEYATIERSHVAADAEISASLAPVSKAPFPERRLPMIPLYRRVSVSRTSAETQTSLPATPKSSTASLSAAEPPPSKEEVEIRQELSLEIFRREEEEREEKEKAEATASAFTEAQKKHIEQTMRQKADVERWRNKQRQRERHRQMEKEMKKKQDEEWRRMAEKKVAEKRRKERKERKEAQKELAGILDPEATQFEEITKRNIRRTSSKTRHWKKSTRSQIHPEIFHESPRSPVVWQAPTPPPAPPTSNHVVQVQPIPGDSSPSPPRRRTLPTQPSHPPYDPRLGPRPPARSTMSRPKSASVVPYPTMGAPLLVQPRNERPHTAGAPPAMMHASAFAARPVATAWGEQQRVPIGEQPVHVTPVYRTQSAQGHYVWNPYNNYRQSFQALYSPSEPELSQPAAPPVYFPGSRSTTSMPQPQLPIQLGSRAPAPAPAPPSHVAPAPLQQPLVKAIQDELERLQRGRKIDHT